MSAPTKAPTKKELMEALVNAEIKRRIDENTAAGDAKRAALMELHAALVAHVLHDFSVLQGFVKAGDCSNWKCDVNIEFQPPNRSDVDKAPMPPAVSAAYQKWSTLPYLPWGWDIGKTQAQRREIAAQLRVKLNGVNAVAVANSVEPEEPLADMPVVSDYLVKFLANLDDTTKAAARLVQ